jgi:cytochrome P450
MVGGHLIEAGTYVQADVLSVHRNPELWGNDAEQFRPERFVG